MRLCSQEVVSTCWLSPHRLRPSPRGLRPLHEPHLCSVVGGAASPCASSFCKTTVVHSMQLQCPSDKCEVTSHDEVFDRPFASRLTDDESIEHSTKEQEGGAACRWLWFRSCILGLLLISSRRTPHPSVVPSALASAWRPVGRAVCAPCGQGHCFACFTEVPPSELCALKSD